MLERGILMADSSPDVLSRKYEERYVAFIDILGFRELIKSSLEKSDTFDILILSLKRIANFTLKDPLLVNNPPDLKAQNFSDNIVISAHLSANGLWHLLIAISDLFWSLSQFGVLLRGGVSRGPLYHDENIVFGPALVDAHHLQQNVAVFPRVVLSRQVYVDAEQYAQLHSMWDTYFSSRLIRADDGPAFLHVLLNLQAFNHSGRSKSSPNAETHPIFESGNNFCRTLRNSLAANMDKPSVYTKLKWFAEYFDREVVARKEPDESFFEPFFPKPAGTHAPCRLPFRHI